MQTSKMLTDTTEARAHLTPPPHGLPQRDDHPAKRFYHPELDVLRFVAFLAVFLSHALPPTGADYLRFGLSPWAADLAASAVAAGGLGVDLFFVLSSYLITELLLREARSRGSIDVRSFYIRRALRIWPLYYAFVLLCFWILPAITHMPAVPVEHKLGFLLLSGNWTTAHLGYVQSPAAALWSVSIEEQFYLLWPLLLAWKGPRSIRPFAIAFFLIASVTRVSLIALAVPHPGIWTNTFARLDPIAIGALTAVALRGRAPNWARSTRALMFVGGAVLLPLSLFTFGINGSGFLLSPDRLLGRWGSLVTYPLVAVGCTLVLLAVLAERPAVRWIQRGPLVYLGRISYGLYVFHVLCLDVIRRFVPSNGFDGALAFQVSAGLVLTMVVAAASYQLFERPFLLLKQRFARVDSRPDFRD